MIKESKVELLSPAGSYQAMMAAFNSGCDGVYIGGRQFGARAQAKNLDDKDLLEAIDQAHIRGKKIYLTVNTLIKEEELNKDLYNYLKKPYEKGIDAIIVQDLGVVKFVSQVFPDLPIHMSTQSSIFMGKSLDILKKYGVKRIVTPRELSLEEIKNVRQSTDLEIESFVHGALCYSYSGQCLMSSLMGDRSGNRGRCAQPCRRSYDLYYNNKHVENLNGSYLLSPKDICGIENIGEMIEAGINTFKIEGRMKSPEYAALVTAIYRKYIDLYYKLGMEGYKSIIKGEEFKKDLLNLQDIYSRGTFSKGYLNNFHGRDMMAMERPNHSGVLVGQVEAIKDYQLIIKLNRELNSQDVLEVRKENEKHFEFTVKDRTSKNKKIRVNISRKKLSPNKRDKRNIFHGGLVEIGDQVYRTRNNKLIKEIQEAYIDENKKIKVKARVKAKINQKLEIEISQGKISVKLRDKLVEEAVKRPISKERIIEQISKTGDSDFEFEEINLDMDKNIFIPISHINEIRRGALDLIKDRISREYRRQTLVEANLIREKKDDFKANNAINLVASFQNKEQGEELLINPNIKDIYLDLQALAEEEIIEFIKKGKTYKKGVYIILPRICRLDTYKKLLKEDLPKIDKNIDGYLVNNLEEIQVLKDLKSEKKIILNHHLYTFNRQTYKFWEREKVTHFTAPLELNYKELKELNINNSDMIVYGYQPAMISAQCLLKNTIGCRKSENENKIFAEIVNKKGDKFFLNSYCKYSYNIIYHSKPLSLIDEMDKIGKLNPKNIRLDFTFESKEDVRKTVELFSASLVEGTFIKKENIKENSHMKKAYKGHFSRGVL